MITDLRHTSLDDVEEFILVLDAWQDAGYRALGGR